MKTVAFIITKSEIGGAQSWVYEQAKALQGECNIILVTSEKGWLTQLPVFTQVEIIPQIISTKSISALYRIVSIIKKYSINTVVASSANAGLYSRLAKLFCQFKCIYVSHGWSCLYNGGRVKTIFCKIEKYLSYLTDIVWCISKSDERKAIDIIGIKPRKIVTLLNSITPLPPKKNREFRGRILFLGRLTYPKRPELIAEVVAENPQYQLDIVGNGEMYTQLHDQFSSFNNISFLGEIQSFRDFNQYDIFVLTSDSEGLPMSALEAGSAGLPMILSDVGGCFEVIGGENGILVNNDVLHMASALSTMANNYDYYFNNAMSYKSEFNISGRANQYKKIIL